MLADCHRVGIFESNRYSKIAVAELVALLEARAYDGRSVSRICRDHETRLVADLQRKFGLDRIATELALRDALAEHERLLHREITGLDLDDAIDAVHQIFGQ